MLVNLRSTHPEFMSLLRKNPDSFSGLQLRELKNGVAAGMVISESEYELKFHDTKYSFTDYGDMSNQIDFQSFCNPRAFLAMNDLFFRHILVTQEAWFKETVPWLGKTLQELDQPGYTHILEVESVYADNLFRSREFVLSKYFPEVKLTHKIGNLYHLKITSNKTLHYTINLAALVMMYLSATNKQPWFISDELSSKYIRIIKNLAPVPYFVLYLFARSFLKSEGAFDKFKIDLESAYGGDLNMVYGNTQEMRLAAVKSNLLINGEVSENVLEIGCGEMDYPRRFLSRINGEHQWWAIDVNDYKHLADRLNERNNTNALHFAKDLSEVPAEIKNDLCVLMVEVIEHMPVEEAAILIMKILTERSPNRVIITTPNKQFNQYFAIDGFRHNDHCFEFTPDEFEAFITAITFVTGETRLAGLYRAEYFGIGDSIGNDYISLGVRLIKN